mmetsp:Transcript_5601/g.22052  ORF Transcript_5601/g.22052 Transcript_5601/m.22052 type:complete len:251 (-) Transcript_5601:412-1164(-)
MLSAVSPTPRQSGDGQRAPPACGNKRRRTCCGAELFAGAPKTGRDPPEHRRGGRGRIRRQECGGRRRDRRHGARHDHALEQRSGHHPEHRGDRRKREDAMQERGLRGWQLCERAHPLSHRRRAELWKGTCPGDCTRSGHDYSRRPQVWCPERRRGSVDQKCMCCRLHHRALPSWRRPRERTQSRDRERLAGRGIGSCRFACHRGAAPDRCAHASPHGPPPGRHRKALRQDGRRSAYRASEWTERPRAVLA